MVVARDPPAACTPGRSFLDEMRAVDVQPDSEIERLLEAVPGDPADHPRLLDHSVAHQVCVHEREDGVPALPREA